MIDEKPDQKEESGIEEEEEGVAEIEDFAEQEKEDSLVIRQQAELDSYYDRAMMIACYVQEKFNQKLKKIIKAKSSFAELKKVRWQDEIYRDDIEPLAEVLTDVNFFAYLLGQSHILDASEVQFSEPGDDFTFIEAVNFFKNKLPMTHDDFQGLHEKLYDKYFYISRVNSQSLVKDIQNELTKAIEKGVPFQKWKKSVNEMFDRKGVTRLNPFHLETVFRTNVMTAYSEGRKQALSTPEMREAFPFWRYSAIMDRKTRSAHRSLHGLVLSSNNTKWTTIYPPNGFNCRCTVIPLDPGYFARKGLPEPKPGELSFIYHQKDEKHKLTNAKARIEKGKKGWNVQIIEGKDFVWPDSDQRFKKKIKFFNTDSNIHGTAEKGFGTKYKNTKVEITEVEITETEIKCYNDLDDADIHIQKELVKKEGYTTIDHRSGVKIALPEKGNSYNEKTISNFLDDIQKRFPKFLTGLKEIRYIPKKITLYDLANKPLNGTAGQYYESFNKIVLLDPHFGTEEVRLWIMKHELGHHVRFKLLLNRKGENLLLSKKLQPEFLEENMADAIGLLIDGKNNAAKELIDKVTKAKSISKGKHDMILRILEIMK
ncbi:MAG: hypothetical protein GY754_11195 [bacterium]|nr:hypothetical protein [bacterium]